MTTRIKIIGGLLVALWVLVVIAVVLLAVMVAQADAAPVSATCTTASWTQRATVYGVRCAGGWCTGRVSTCGTWGCAYGRISGSPRAVFTGRAVTVRIGRANSCRYSLSVLR